jgi:hypothetical protein
LVLLLRARLPRAGLFIWGEAEEGGGDCGVLSVPGVASAADPVLARRLERLLGGGGAAAPWTGVIRPVPGIGDEGTDVPMGSSMSAMGVIGACLVPEPLCPFPPRAPNMACVAQPVVEVGKENRSGEARSFLALAWACDIELVGPNASVPSGFMLSRSQVSTLEFVESLRCPGLYLDASPPQPLSSRVRGFTNSAAGRGVRVSCVVTPV